MRDRFPVVVLAVLLSLPRAVAAQAPAPAVVIHRTALDPATGLLTITGVGLGPELTVLFEGQPVPVLAGASATEIQVQVPLGAAPGSSRVVLLDPAHRAGDAFVVTTAMPAHGGPIAGAIVAPAPAADARDPRATDAGGRAFPAASPPPRTSPLYFESADNTALGLTALYSNTTGTQNVAIGVAALVTNSTGSHNTATGHAAILGNTVGTRNTGTGFAALAANQTGASNTGLGAEALRLNSSGQFNTAAGDSALFNNTTGLNNVATGVQALYNNSTSSDSVATGTSALFNSTGPLNVADGTSALYSLTTGTSNTALGDRAGFNATTGSHNIFVGASVVGTAADANTMRLGLPYDGATGAGQNKTFVAGIFGTQLTAPAQAVFVDANGQLGIVGPQVTTGGGTTTPAANPRDFEALSALVRSQQATIDALQQQMAALRAEVSTPRTGRRR